MDYAAFFYKNPILLIGVGILALISYIAASGRISKKDPAMIYTFGASIVIIIMGVFSSYNHIKMAKAYQAQQQAAPAATPPSTPNP